LKLSETKGFVSDLSEYTETRMFQLFRLFLFNQKRFEKTEGRGKVGGKGGGREGEGRGKGGRREGERREKGGRRQGEGREGEEKGKGKV
jgi:hypothetical protein